jgi:site-specific recombinase XerD
MTKTFNILFYVRRDKADEQGNAPVYCRITVDGKRSELAIKRQVALTKWQPSKGYVKGTNEEARSLNTYIDSVRTKIYEHQKLLMDANKPVTAEAIKNSFLGISQKSKSLFQMFEEHNEKIKQLVGKQFAQGTHERYVTVLKHLKEFVQKRYSLSEYYVGEVNHEFIQEFDHFLRVVHNCANNSASQYLKNFKKIIRLATAKGLISIDPFLNYKIKLKKVDRGFLLQEELDAIQAKTFTIPRLSQVRDIFLFQCYTGLAYADLKKLSKEHIIKGADGELWISTHRTKTDTAVNVPLLPEAVAILNKYESHPESNNKGLLLPVLSNQKMNAYLKEIGDLCGITKNLSSHIGRHTFASQVTLANGISLEVVSKMLGHSNINTTKIYARMVDSRVSEEMQGLKGRMSLKAAKSA